MEETHIIINVLPRQCGKTEMLIKRASEFPLPVIIGFDKKSTLYIKDNLLNRYGVKSIDNHRISYSLVRKGDPVFVDEYDLFCRESKFLIFDMINRCSPSIVEIYTSPSKGRNLILPDPIVSRNEDLFYDERSTVYMVSLVSGINSYRYKYVLNVLKYGSVVGKFKTIQI